MWDCKFKSSPFYICIIQSIPKAAVKKEGNCSDLKACSFVMLIYSTNFSYNLFWELRTFR